MITVMRATSPRLAGRELTLRDRDPIEASRAGASARGLLFNRVITPAPHSPFPIPLTLLSA